MKERATAQIPRPRRATPDSAKKSWVKRHPLVSTIVTSAVMVFAGALVWSTLHRNPAPQPAEGKAPDAGQVSKGKGSRGMKKLRAYFQIRQKIMDAGHWDSFQSGPEDDFEAWKEGLALRSTKELYVMWDVQDIIIEREADRFMATRKSSRTEADDAREKGKEARKRKKAVSEELRKRREAGEEMPEEEKQGVELDAEWVESLGDKTVEELDAMWDNEMAAKAEAIDDYLSAMERRNRREAADAFARVAEAKARINAIQNEGSTRVSGGGPEPSKI